MSKLNHENPKKSGFNLPYLLKMHRAILTKDEKKKFLFLTIFFLISSIFDIVGIGAIGSFLVIMMNPAIIFSMPILSRFLPNNLATHQALILLGSIVLLAFIIKTILSCIVQKQMISYCFQVGARIRVELMQRYLYAPYSYFVTHHSSDMINKILSHASTYSSLSLVSFMTMLVHSIFVMAITTFLFIFHPGVTAILITLFACMFIVHMLMVRGTLYEIGQNLSSSGTQIVKSIQEAFSGLKEVRILSKEQFFLDKVEKASVIHADSHGYISIYQKLPFYLLESIMFVFIISLCLGELSLGVNVQSIIALCGVLVTAGIRLLPSLYQIVSSLVTIQGNQYTLETIYQSLFCSYSEFKNELPWPRNTSIAKHTTKDFSVIQFDHVSYSYPDMQLQALSNINLSIKKGQSIGIVGASGAGKSTLIDLLLGLLTPVSGKILIDGQPITEKKLWVDRFAYIPQAIYLLDATVTQNIVFGEPEINETRLKRAVQMAQLDEVIANLPQGMNTNIGENGVKLSGGQRQRIALARAFYHEREIIVMDEATAALDNDTEYEVVESIKRLHQLKTIVTIAHRYTTVAHCDIIYRLHQGKLVDSGSYYDVIVKPQQLANAHAVV